MTNEDLTIPNRPCGKVSAWLFAHAHNVYSQYGEDGVLLAALTLLPDRDKCCVEFGAWDGLHLSNTANLIRHHGHHGIFIEGDAAKVEELKRNYADNEKVKCFCQMVGWSSHDGLDTILAQTDLPHNFDLLSIDIDGNDYYVWEALNNYAPKLVIIEFNQTIPTEVVYCQPRQPELNVGASIEAINRLARRKGYELISILRNNLVFVKKEYFELFQIADNSPASLRKDVSDITWIFSGYDGSVHCAGSGRLPWHSLNYRPERMQVLPRWLRVFPPCYGALQRLLFRCLSWWHRKQFPQKTHDNDPNK